MEGREKSELIVSLDVSKKEKRPGKKQEVAAPLARGKKRERRVVSNWICVEASKRVKNQRRKGSLSRASPGGRDRPLRYLGAEGKKKRMTISLNLKVQELKGGGKANAFRHREKTVSLLPLQGKGEKRDSS